MCVRRNDGRLRIFYSTVSEIAKMLPWMRLFIRPWIVVKIALNPNEDCYFRDAQGAQTFVICFSETEQRFELWLCSYVYTRSRNPSEFMKKSFIL